MPLLRLRGLLIAACLPLLLAACGSEPPSVISAPDDLSSGGDARVKMTLVSGGRQSGTPGQPLSAPVVVRVTDPAGQPMVDWPISFDPGVNADADARRGRTDSNGYAATLWTLGPAVGTQTLRVTGTGGLLTVSATALPGDGSHVGLVKRGGEEQSAAAGAQLPASIQTTVVRDDGALVMGAMVSYKASGGGTVSAASARTGTDGVASVRWVLGPGGGEQTLTASVRGAAPVTYTATATGGVLRAAAVELVLAPDSLVLDVGQTGVFTATLDNPGQPQLPGQAPKWFTSNPLVAVVDGQGTVRGVGAGTAVITATLGSHVAFATVRVRGPLPASLQLVPDSLALDVGAEGVLTAVIRTAVGVPIPGLVPTWSSSAPGVATVDAVGKVRGVAAGTARVTATLGTLSASATVRVRGGPATLEIVPDSLVVDVGATGRLYAVVRDATGAQVPGTAPAWTSSAPGVATVDAQGQVRGVAAGTARVTATLGSLSASATVRVRTIPGPTLELFPDSLVLDVGVWARVYPVAHDASGKPVIVDYAVQWSTSSDQVVYPFADGALFPQGPGTARVTARWGNVTASIPVRVRQPRGGSLRIPQIQMRAGYAPKIEATTRDLDTNWWIHISQRNVSAVSMRVRGPSGRTIDCTNSGPESIYADEFRCDLTIPRGSEPGVWKVDRVTVTKDGQTTTFTAADLEAQGTLGRSFDLFGTGPDTQAPVVRTIWPHQGSRYPDIYYVNLGILDHVSGMRSARMTVRGPGGVTHTCEMTSATALCRLPLRPGSGTWDVVSVETEDAAGNRATYTAQQIAQLASGTSEAPFLLFSFTP